MPIHKQRLDSNRNGERSRGNAKEPSLLVGLIVDSDGRRFTPSHTVKAGRRYRYYVDRALITGDKPSGRQLRRIPAREIEDIVRAQLAALLGEPGRLLQALGDPLDASASETAIQRAGKLRQQLTDASCGAAADVIRSIMQQVVIGDDTVRLRIKRDGLRAALSLPAGPKEDSSEASIGVDDALYDLDVQTRLRMRGGQIRLIVGQQRDLTRVEDDAALIKALARAHLWFDRLERGDAGSISQIAQDEQVSGSYVSRVLRLAFLAPDIVEAIMDGRHPVDLTAERLLIHENLPLNWREQRRQLGFHPR